MIQEDIEAFPKESYNITWSMSIWQLAWKLWDIGIWERQAHSGVLGLMSL